MANKLIDAMGFVSELNKTHGIKQRGGKMYTQVVHRMEAFRTVFGTELGVDTSILVDDGQRVVVKASIINSDGMTIGSGMAEEIRGQGHVNTTSALENCETSAIGRALSSIGLSGGEYASSNEMDAVVRKTDALKQEPAKPVEPAIKDSKAQEVVDKIKEEFPGAKVSAESQTDAYAEQDKSLFAQLEFRLNKQGGLSGVHHLFNEFKPKIKEIQSRNPKRAEHFMALLKEYEAKFL